MRREDVAIITTTINPKPETYVEYAKQGKLIVAGDKNTPNELYEYVESLGGMALRPADQIRMHPALSEIIGWRSIQRRNFALLAALRDETFKYIITVDDDNIPGPHFVDKHVDILDGKYTAKLEARGHHWLNIGDLVQPRVWQRGTPYGHPVATLLVELVDRPRVVVSQSQVFAAPDCDAITRLTEDPYVLSIGPDVVVKPRRTTNFMAFNSQATAYAAEYAPLIAVLPFVGRYDDIIASFIARHVIAVHGHGIHVGGPAVTQERNAHDFTKDLAGEVWGLKNSYTIANAIAESPTGPHYSVMDSYHILAHSLDGILPRETTRFMLAWHDAVTKGTS